MSQFVEELKKAARSSYPPNIGQLLLKYVTQGDEAALAQAKQQVGPRSWSLYWLGVAWAHLSAPSELSDEEKRAMHAGVALGQDDDLAGWLGQRLAQAPPDEEAYLAAFLEAFPGGKTGRIKAAAAMLQYTSYCLVRGDGQPNAAGRFLLDLSDEDLAAAADKTLRIENSLEFLLKHAAKRLPAIVSSFLYQGERPNRMLCEDCCQILLAADSRTYEKPIAEAAANEKAHGPKAKALELLTNCFPKKYRDQAREAALSLLGNRDWGHQSGDGCRWLAKTFGAQVVPEIAERLTINPKCPHAWTSACLNVLADELGEAAAPVAVAVAAKGVHEARLAAIDQLLKWPSANHDNVLRAAIEEGLACDDASLVVRYIGLAGRGQTASFAAQLWKLFEHKSKPVRAAAARALGRLGDEAVARACELLVAKKAAVRATAVMLLAAAQTSAAAAALEGRLDDESDEETRDQILLALDRVWQAQGKKISRKEIEQRIERTLPKLAKPVAEWIAEDRLPPLHWAKGGETLAPQAVRYLLYRQSRAKLIEADVECKPLYALLDRKTAGDFALAVLQMFLASKMAAEDRWAMAVAGLLGDDRVVPVLMQQIRKWVDANRGKLGEYAAEALALLGTDVALCAVDSLSIRYRSKQKNIGKAASEAFAEAAQRLGITVDELGDRVVPWLGFEPGKPRLLEYGDKRIEVRVGLDFKIEFRDLAKGKKIATLPAGIPAEVKTEFKDLGATLREVIKGQLVRMENLMVRQFRWPVPRWRELYLAHPILFPFAARMVWGLYSPEGTLQATFRALEDRTFTDEQDGAVELPESPPEGTAIGLVHPLELTPEKRQAWAVHLADYRVESPFLQMERPVVYPDDGEKGTKISSKYSGTELNGMTFKGRAERLGWQRGSVCDGGGITSYCKSFPGAGADAILALDGMYIGIDMESTIKLEKFCFVKGGSVSFGSYEYDEPSDEKDARLLPFAQVPPVVFSETLGDLAKIAGKKEEEE
jgi:hypothetical protein